MDKQSKQSTIDDFISVAESYLRKRIPASQSETALQEAREHMEERAKELMASGINEKQAEAIAVKMFGKPISWARDIAQAAYTDTFTGIARNLVIIAATTALLSPILLALNHWLILEVTLITAISLVLLCSFRARQFFAKSLFLMAILPCLLNFIVFGSIFVTSSIISMYSRAELRDKMGFNENIVKGQQQVVDLLKLGMNTFRSNSTSVPVPPSLIYNNEYIVPQQLDDPTSDSYIFLSPFKRLPKIGCSYAMIDKYNPLDMPVPYRTVASREEAVKIWQAEGPDWLDSSEDLLALDQKNIAEAHRIANLPPGFDAKAGLFGIYLVSGGAVVIVLLHLFGAYAGRVVYRYRIRNRRLVE